MNTLKLKDATITDVVIEHELLEEYMSDLIQCYYDVTIKFDNDTAIVIESFTEPYGQCCGIMSVNDLFFNLSVVDNSNVTLVELFENAFLHNIRGGFIVTVVRPRQEDVSFMLSFSIGDELVPEMRYVEDSSLGVTDIVQKVTELIS